MTLVAGVDSSTQSVKVVVCDADTGEVVRSGRASHPDGTEVSAAAWLSAYREATADPSLLEGVEAISVGGQQHGMVTLDADGELVRDALLWNDNRSAQAALDLIDDLGGAQAWADAVGAVPVASFTASKIRWLARNEPENAARVHRVVLPHDYLTWEIGGRSFDPVTDRGDASGTAYFDAVADSYRDDLVELAFGRGLELPRVAAPDEVVGESPEGMKIGPGTGDNAASVLGMVVPDRTALISLGTSGVACLRSDRQTHDASGVVAGFADATGAFLPLVCTLNGARNLVAMAKTLNVSLDEFSALAVSAPAGSEGLVFLPYLEGERTPAAAGRSRRAPRCHPVQPDRSQPGPRHHRGRALEPRVRGAGAARAGLPGRPGDADRRCGPVAGGAHHRRCRLRGPGAGHRPVRERGRGGRPAGRLGADRVAAGLVGADLGHVRAPAGGDRGCCRAGRALPGGAGRGDGAVLRASESGTYSAYRWR